MKGNTVIVALIFFIVTLTIASCSTGLVTDDIIPNNHKDSLYTEKNYCELYGGPCKKVPIMYRCNTIIYGKFLNGYTGDFDCGSDIYTKNGIRISPGNSEGMVWFNFGPIIADSVKITFQWVDNAWFSAGKNLSIFNFKNNNWKIIFKMNNKRREEHFTIKWIMLKSEYLDSNKMIKIAFYSSAFSIIHLNSVKLNYE